MELVSCHNSFLLGYTEITGPVLLLSNDSHVLVVLLQVLVGTRMLNFDNVGPSGELHDIVKELFNILLVFLLNLGSYSFLLNLSLLILGS